MKYILLISSLANGPHGTFYIHTYGGEFDALSACHQAARVMEVMKTTMASCHRKGAFVWEKQ